MSILVKGDDVQLVDSAKEETINIPPSYVLCHDTSGHYMPRCHFYLLNYQLEGCMDCEYNADLMDTARAYYGDSMKFEKGAIAVPRGPWQGLGAIDAIRYRRRGFRSGHYEHVFLQGVRVQECAKPHGYRILLPDGCVANERGFVKP